MIENFRWLVEGKLAGSGVPRNIEDVEWLKLKGIETVISFSKVSEKLIERIKSLGMHHHEILIEDYGTPEYVQINRFLDLLEKEIAEEHSTLMHCYAGVGRTGLMYAIYLVNGGDDWRQAIEKGGGLETGSQRLCVQIFQEHRIAQAGVH